jgi:hypothetical protein
MRHKRRKIGAVVGACPMEATLTIREGDFSVSAWRTEADAGIVDQHGGL